MRPVDPRLPVVVPAVRGYLGRLGLVSVAATGLTVAQAWLLVDLVVTVFADGAGPGQLAGRLWLLVAVTAGRAGLGLVGARLAARTAPRIVTRLRDAALAAAVSARGAGREIPSTGELAVTTGTGLDGAGPYLTRFLPALVGLATVPPLMLVCVGVADPVSALILAGTLPLVPVFMVLVGQATRERTDAQWAVLGRLSGHFLDVVRGLATLRVFGRADRQVTTIRAVTDAYRRRTLAALRWAFLSSLVLELLVTLSVALVAVAVGIRLVHGSTDLRTGLFVLLLAPELFAPVRQVGAAYHAAAAGAAALGGALDLVRPEGASPGAAPTPPRRPAPQAWGAVRLDGVTVRRPGRPEPALSDVDLTVRRGEVVALVGPSGAGKSTVLALLRGAIAPEHGQVLVDGVELGTVDRDNWRDRIAWLPQRPRAVCGATVADEVRLGRPDATDDEVAEALAAAAAPPGDRLVGQDGGQLSTGELRRVALARVLVRHAELVLLDEPTESLDAATEEHVAHAVAALRARATVVLVAHSPTTAVIADRAVRLAGGRVTEAGRSTRPGHGRAPAQPAGTHVVAPPATTLSAGQVPAAGAMPAGRPARAGRAGRGVRPYGEDAVSRGATRQLLRYYRPAWRRLSLGVVAGAGATCAATALTAASAWLICRAWQQPPVLALLVAVVGVRAFGLSRPVLRYAERLLTHDAALRGLAELRTGVFARLVPLAPATLAATRRGEVLRRFTHDVDDAGESLLRGAVPVATAALAVAATAALVVVLLPAAAPVLAGGLSVVAGLVWFAGRRVRADTDALARARQHRDAEVVELFDGIDELAAFGGAQARLARLRRADDAVVELAARPGVAAGRAAAGVTLVAGLSAAAVVAIAAGSVRAGELAGVAVAVVVLTTAALFEPLGALAEATAALLQARDAAARVFGLLASAPRPSRGAAVPAAAAVPAGAVPVGAVPTQPVAESGPGDGAATVELDGVTVRYAGPNGARTVLDDVSLTVPAGCRLAVVGPSGAGKSTLVALLLGFVTPTSGRVRLGGHDLAGLDAGQLRRQVVGLTQDAHVFDATLRDNLLLARPDATDADLRAALRRVRLDDWLATLPAELATRVGSDGAAMSGGQRQRLLLARLLLADAPVMVFDEPTAHLDPHAAAALLDVLFEVTQGRTVVLVTHRAAEHDPRLDAVVEVRDGQLRARRAARIGSAVAA